MAVCVRCYDFMRYVPNDLCLVSCPLMRSQELGVLMRGQCPILGLGESCMGHG